MKADKILSLLASLLLAIAGCGAGESSSRADGDETERADVADADETAEFSDADEGAEPDADDAPCAPGTYRCEPGESNVNRCDQNGVWVYYRNCALDGAVCVAGDCVLPEIEEEEAAAGACEFGAFRCRPESATIERCEWNGEWTFFRDCALYGKVCVAGECAASGDAEPEAESEPEPESDATLCASDADCAPAEKYFCDARDGRCHRRRILCEPCTAAAECATSETSLPQCLIDAHSGASVCGRVCEINPWGACPYGFDCDADHQCRPNGAHWVCCTDADCAGNPDRPYCNPLTHSCDEPCDEKKLGCGVGKICLSGHCLFSCSSDRDCAAGERCDAASRACEALP